MSKFTHLTDNEVPIMGPLTVGELLALLKSLPDSTKLVIRNGRITAGCKLEIHMDDYENKRAHIVLVARDGSNVDLCELRSELNRDLTIKIKIRWIGRTHNKYQVLEYAVPTSKNRRQIVFEVIDK